MIPQSLVRWFEDCDSAIVAFSGGVDSSVAAFVASQLLGSERTRAVISDSPSLKRRDLAEAKAFCHLHGIPLHIVKTKEMEDPNYISNSGSRCYFCKHALYEELLEIVAENPGSWVINGTNSDDLGDYRPGLKAAAQFHVRSPLAECGLDKHAVRKLAAALGLECWDKPASPCLSSRIPYGQPVTPKKLWQVEEAEFILNRAGFHVVRFRHFGKEGRIEVPAEDLLRLREVLGVIEPAIRSLGFEQVVLDEEGFVSGKLNRAILSHGSKITV